MATLKSVIKTAQTETGLVLRGTTLLKLPLSLVLVVVDVLWFLEVDTVSYSVLSSRYSLPTCFHRTYPSQSTL
jgi:hypothetical protein